MKVVLAEGTGADRPDEGIIRRPQTVQLGYCCRFIISVTKLYSYKEVTENKAMQGRVWGGVYSA